jgi:CubicO group peptidase (beta-lactamase class C family)
MEERMDLEMLESLVEEQRQIYGVAGLALAIIDGRECVYERAFGHQSGDPSAPLTADSLFLAGSLTKPIFAYIVLQLCEQGLLDLDTPLSGLWPERYSSDPRLAQVTARHVLSHATGFPNWREGDALPILTPPGQTFEYSGEGYAYLQKVVEAVTGAPLDAAWRALVRDPLNMASSQLSLDALPPASDLAGISLPDRMRAEVSAAWSLVTTAGDYARFMIALQPDAAPGLSAASRAAMLTPQSVVDKDLDLSWGLGWGLQPLGRDSAFWHWGKIGSMTDGYDSYAVMLRQRQRGAVILTNSVNGLKLCDLIARAALEITVPQPAFGWLKH